MKKLTALLAAALFASSTAMAAPQQDAADAGGASATGIGDMSPTALGFTAVGVAVAIAVIADGGSDDGGACVGSDCPPPPPPPPPPTTTSTVTGTN